AMAMILPPQSSATPVSPERQLNQAVDEFQSILTENQRTALKKIKSVPDADAVLVFTAELDYSSRPRKGRSIATRLHSVLQSVREFSAVIDTFVSSNPEIAALIWGSVKLTIQLFNALWRSFEQEFRSDISSVQWCGKEVRREIDLAKAHADRQDQELRRKESEAATGRWRRVQDVLFRTESGLDTIKEGQLQQDKRRSRERRRQLLDSLSSYEYLPPFKRACKARHCGTAQWVFQTDEFQRWKAGARSPWIWCSGKLGSGKTILMASAVNHVLTHKSGPGEIVAFFFPQLDDPQSLCAETVIRSIIRQSIDPVTLSGEMEADLAELYQKPSTGLVELTALLQQRVAQSKMFYIFIDALDEFLWVTFLIDELCAQHCDDDIRNAMGCLPKTLTETFNRALLRIVARRKAPVAGKTFSWVTVAKRHLTLEELREAISIDIGQSYSQAGRLVNGIDQLATWCENLIHVEEEEKTVQFAHPVIHKFIVDGPVGPQFTDFCFNPAGADHHAGEICVTYLHFNDFKTTLARRQRPIPVHPLGMAKLALSRHLKVPSSVSGTGFSLKQDKSKTELDQQFNALDPDLLAWSLQSRHYALIRHIQSCGGISEPEKLQDIWSLAGEGDIELLDVLLEGESSLRMPSTALRRASKDGYLAIVERLLTAGADVNAVPGVEIGRTALQAASEDGRLAVVGRLLIAGADVNAGPAESHGRTALQAASGGGHLAVVERLLAAGADINASPAESYGLTALQAASEGGHITVVERLLTAGADVNAGPAESHGQTALQAASGGGHLAVVKRLLIRGADVNAGPAKFGRTALQAASWGGHLTVIKQLLRAGAAVNASPTKYYGLTALQAASWGGHLIVIKQLLKAGADVNTGPAEYYGRTALQAASGGGHLEVVERLLIAGAAVNASPAKYHGRTALQAASEGGYLVVVERLLAAGADVNAGPAGQDGRTALQAASERGHLPVVQQLERELKRTSR
ncbi:ankyrin repeat-containing domain protein, partial [Echria macrotheca]